MRYYWLFIERVCAGMARTLARLAEVFCAMANAAVAKKNEVRKL